MRGLGTMISDSTLGRFDALTAVLLLAIATPAAAQDLRTVSIGQTVSGELTSADPRGLRARKAPYHVWYMQGRRGQRIVVDLRSDDFDSYLVLRDDDGFVLGSDDDGGSGQNARLHTVLPRDGRYRVVVTAYTDSARGGYELTVSGWETPNAAAAGMSATLGVGESKDGILEPGDEVAGDGPYLDRWTMNLRAGQRARATMHSSDFDSYLILNGPDGSTIATDDDGGEEGNDAEISFRAASAGTYTLLATSFNDNARVGAYRVSLAEESGNFPEPGTETPIASGETKEGRIEAGDTRGRRGPEDRWTFQGREGQLARIDVLSENRFDSYLVLERNGMPVDSNDDGGDGNNARLMTILPATGTYTIVVSKFSEGGNGGRYNLVLNVSEAPAGAGRVERLQPGQRVSGRLEPGDRPRSGGGYQDLFEFEGRSGQDVVVELHSSDFDPFLELRDPDGNLVADDDDGGEGRDAMIMTRLSRAGRYRVVARSYGESDASGFYELTLATAGDVVRPGRPGEVRENQTVLGRLEQGDSVIGDSTFADVYTFRAPRDGEIQIDLRSGDFDAYLMVKSSNGGTLATDDDGAGEGTNSRITLQVRSGQTYRIYANSYGEDRATGLYRLSVHYGR